MGFLNAALVGILNFFQFTKKKKNWVLWIKVWTVLLNFSQFTAELRNWDFWSPLDFIFFQIGRIVFQAHYVSTREGKPIYDTTGSIYEEEMFILIQKKFYITLTAGNTFYLEQTILVHLNLTLLGVFPICSNIFPIIVECRFFSSGKDPNIPMNVLEDYIISLI